MSELQSMSVYVLDPVGPPGKIFQVIPVGTILVECRRCRQPLQANGFVVKELFRDPKISVMDEECFKIACVKVTSVTDMGGPPKDLERAHRIANEVNRRWN